MTTAWRVIREEERALAVTGLWECNASWGIKDWRVKGRGGYFVS